eukprot:6361084-Amphidinium_carterae.1
MVSSEGTLLVGSRASSKSSNAFTPQCTPTVCRSSSDQVPSKQRPWRIHSRRGGCFPHMLARWNLDSGSVRGGLLEGARCRGCHFCALVQSSERRAACQVCNPWGFVRALNLAGHSDGLMGLLVVERRISAFQVAAFRVLSQSPA